MIRSSAYFLGAAVLMMASTASAQILIDSVTNNGSFELVGGEAVATKATTWDGQDGSPDVDFWTEWSEVSTANGDSGTEVGGTASNGSRVAFLQPNNAVYNLTSHVASAGDEFFLSWDHTLRNSSYTVTFVYDDGGTITQFSDIAASFESAAEGLGRSIEYTLPGDSPAIGSAIGVGIINNNSNYPELDNFFLSANFTLLDGDVDGDGLVGHRRLHDHP